MDIRAAITNTIIDMLEQGIAGEWERPWATVAASGLPTNYTSGRRYTGINVLLLWHAAQQRGLAHNEWLTFKQAQEIGASVRKGAKGVMCIFYKMAEVRSNAAASDDCEEDGKPVPLLKPFWLFNVADIDGLPQLDGSTGANDFESIAEAEAILQASGAHFEHGGNSAYYCPDPDLIRLPQREQFKTLAAYYATAIHELVHWTGHKSRLAREFGKRFGDDAYAFEELVAELGNAFVMAELGLTDYTLQGHASYLAHWLRVLKNDKNAIFTAAKHASAAHALILSHTGDDHQASA